jgi:hypothetical protein
LSVKVIKAGVVPERIAPGKPQQNGRLERLHLTLLQDTASPPAQSLREQLMRLRSFQRLYNEERPHQALGNDTPAEHYAASPRRFDGVLRAPNYSLPSLKMTVTSESLSPQGSDGGDSWSGKRLPSRST